jgi:hypothetical protein
MPRRVGFAAHRLSLEEIAEHREVLLEALDVYFQAQNHPFLSRFVGYSDREVADERRKRLYEVEVASAFSVMAVLEAAFRIDYLQRSYRRMKDAISRDFRELHKQKGPRASLEDDIFEVWRAHIRPQGLIGDLRSAFNFRHWVAHGRYWQPKLGRAYDFDTVYALAETVLTDFPLKSAP